MLSSVTIYCKVTMIVMTWGSQMSQMSSLITKLHLMWLSKLFKFFKNKKMSKTVKINMVTIGKTKMYTNCKKSVKIFKIVKVSGSLFAFGGRTYLPTDIGRYRAAVSATGWTAKKRTLACPKDNLWCHSLMSLSISISHISIISVIINRHKSMIMR